MPCLESKTLVSDCSHTAGQQHGETLHLNDKAEIHFEREISFANEASRVEMILFS